MIASAFSTTRLFASRLKTSIPVAILVGWGASVCLSVYLSVCICMYVCELYLKGDLWHVICIGVMCVHVSAHACHGNDLLTSLMCAFV